MHNSAVGRAPGGLGISLGGLRMLPYTEKDTEILGPDPETRALVDVLRLSKGMTEKSAAANDGCGGAKAVILANPKDYPPDSDQRGKLMRAMGAALNEFNTRYPNSTYVTAEDMNIKKEDLQIIAEVAPKYVSGIGHREFDGNPSPFTALGVLTAMKAALGVETMKEKNVAVAGIGSVGKSLASRLLKEGATVFITDTNQAAITAFQQEFSTFADRIQVVAPEEIHKQAVDVYAPCAKGACLNDVTLPGIQAQYIIGAANNQLEKPEHGVALYKAGKIYVPDYIANAGGVMAVAMEVKHRREGTPLTVAEIETAVEEKIRENVERVMNITHNHSFTGNNKLHREEGSDKYVEFNNDHVIPHSESGTKLAASRVARAEEAIARQQARRAGGGVGFWAAP